MNQKTSSVDGLRNALGADHARSMLPLSETSWRRLRREYRRLWGIVPRRIRCDGITEDAKQDPLGLIPSVIQARRRAIEESLRWGEPYVFLLADGVVSWVVALVDGETLLGGLCGTDVVTEGEPLDVDAATRHLGRWESSHASVEKYLAGLSEWPQEQVRAAAQSLAEVAYAVSGWTPLRWKRNRADAEQQRQIAEAIHHGKKTGARGWALAEERRLLQIIRAGDLKGARRHLNQLLAEMFLDSPRLPVLQARALELLGYLVRVAVEDEPECAALMSSHQEWMVRIIGTTGFEDLCTTVRDALDDFMGQVASQGLATSARHVRCALNQMEEALPRAPSLDEAAAVVGISRFRLSHLFKEATGQSFGVHAARLRVEYASRCLATTERGCADIAVELGFADQSHFTRVFRSVTGTTPACYRRAHLHASQPVGRAIGGSCTPPDE